MTAKNDDYYHLGLTDSEVLQSREKNGVNLLTPPKRPSLWKLYLEKFEDPVVRVLLVAAVFSLIISIIENELLFCWLLVSVSFLSMMRTRNLTC